MAQVVFHDSPGLGAEGWLGWRDEAWIPGISPVLQFDPFLGGFVIVPTTDAQLLHLQSGPMAGMLVRLVGDSSLSITGNFSDPNPTPLSGSITGIEIYDRYEDLLNFDAPGGGVLTSAGQPWDGQMLAEATGLSIDAASLQDTANLASAIFAAFAGGADTIIGSVLADRIEAGAGHDTINGGAGADTMIGGAGNDLYYVDTAGDRVAEGAGGGSDRIAASVDYTLAAGVHVEQLQTTSSAGTAPLKLTGNALAQKIYGNAGNNVLSDGGGGGADTLYGSLGNDTYIVRNAKTKIEEFSGGGTDKVAAGVDFRLAGGDHVEVLTTTSSGGTAGIDLTGNDFNQRILGNDGANRIDARGGFDTVSGLGGPIPSSSPRRSAPRTSPGSPITTWSRTGSSWMTPPLPACPSARWRRGGSAPMPRVRRSMPRTGSSTIRRTAISISIPTGWAAPGGSISRPWIRVWQ